MDSDLSHEALQRFEALEARVSALENASGMPTDEEEDEEEYEDSQEESD
jgi:hypothetical protein